MRTLGGLLLAAVLLVAALAVDTSPAAALMTLSGTDHDCSDFSTQAEAQAYFDGQGYSAANDPERLDSARGQGNGRACESLPSGAAPAQPDRGDDTVVEPDPSPDLRERDVVSRGPAKDVQE